MGLLPTEGKFFDYFEQLSEKIEEGGLLFSTILDEFATSEGRLTRIKEIEKEADKITLGIYQNIVFCDFDARPRERSVVVQVMGV